MEIKESSKVFPPELYSLQMFPNRLAKSQEGKWISEASQLVRLQIPHAIGGLFGHFEVLLV